jgi:mercuric reductase
MKKLNYDPSFKMECHTLIIAKNGMLTNRRKVMRIAIIGSGSGAFAAAIQASNKGNEVFIIEKGTIGGTCVNVGCVPSKIFIRAAEAAHVQSAHPFSGLGKAVTTFNRRALTMQQQARVEELRFAKYTSILEANKHIHLIPGFASFKDGHTLIIEAADGSKEELAADRILIATGSSAFIPNISGLKDTPYWTSTEALQTETQPESLAVIGGSVVALELAQAYARFGTKVTILARSTLLSKEDADIGVGLKAALEAEGIRILTHTVPTSVSHDAAGFHLTLPDTSVLTTNQLLVATGRHANTQQLNLAAAEVDVDAHGNVIIDDEMRTNVPHIFAAGDCTSQPQYVYVAAAAGSRAAANMLGRHVKLNLSIMPAVVFTDPQVATVGLTEAQASEQGLNVESRLLTLDNVPRALSAFNTAGFIKLVAEKRTGKILGAQILAHEGSETIQTVAVAMHANMRIRDLSRMLFPYLTMAEGLKLCAQTFTKNVNELSCCADTGVDDEEDEGVDCCAKPLSDTVEHDCCASASSSNASSQASYTSIFSPRPPDLNTEGDEEAAGSAHRAVPKT